MPQPRSRVGLGAERLVFLTDVDGLIVDGEVVDAIDVDARERAARRRPLRRRHRPEAPRRGDRSRRAASPPRSAARRSSREHASLQPARVLPTYARLDVTFVDGDGSWLSTTTGKRYLDLFAGIAVVGLGHCHPAPLAAAHAQLDRLWHVSNLYSTEPMERPAPTSSPSGSAARRRSSATRAPRRSRPRSSGREGDGQDRDRRARGLVPRAHDGRALDHRAAGEARAFEPLVPGARLRDAGDARRARRPADRRDPARARAGRGRRAAARRRRRSPRRARSPTSTARC